MYSGLTRKKKEGLQLDETLFHTFQKTSTGEIVQILKCSEIIGMPTTTYDTRITGSIEVAMIESVGEDMALHFSVVEGFSEIKIKESFVNYLLKGSAMFCCCADAFGLNADGYNISYQATNESLNQFYILPIKQTVFDAMTYRTTAKVATASTANASIFKQELSYDCFKNCCIDCCSCKCMKCCECCSCSCCPSCCSLSCCTFSGCMKAMSDEKGKTVEFSAYERRALGVDPIESKSIERNLEGAVWTLEKLGEDSIFIIIHYKSILDNEVHTIRLKLRNQKDANVTFEQAKRFIAMISSQRGSFPHSSLNVGPAKREALQKAIQLDDAGNAIKEEDGDIFSLILGLAGMKGDKLGGSSTVTSNSSKEDESGGNLVKIVTDYLYCCSFYQCCCGCCGCLPTCCPTCCPWPGAKKGGK